MAAERCLASGMSWVVTFLPGHAVADCVLPLCAQPERALPKACFSAHPAPPQGGLIHTLFG